MSSAIRGLDVPGLDEVQLIGRGGFSQVFRARQIQFDRVVAVKVLLVDDFDEDAQRRFLRECRATGRLSSHPNIVSVYDAGVTADNKPFIVMEYWDGGSMATRLREKGPLPVADIVDIGTKISGALAAAHESGILHRDVKPANILSAVGGRFALADFGISSSTDSSRSVQTDALTIDYAPPEVLHGAEPDARSDLYSLGITLYTLLMGTPPYRSAANTPVAQQLVRILQDPVPRVTRPDAPPELCDLIQTLMEKDPDQRPDDAERAVRNVLRHRQSIAQERTGARDRRRPGRHDYPTPAHCRTSSRNDPAPVSSRPSRNRHQSPTTVASTTGSGRAPDPRGRYCPGGRRAIRHQRNHTE